MKTTATEMNDDYPRIAPRLQEEIKKFMQEGDVKDIPRISDLHTIWWGLRLAEDWMDNYREIGTRLQDLEEWQENKVREAHEKCQDLTPSLETINSVWVGEGVPHDVQIARARPFRVLQKALGRLEAYYERKENKAWCLQRAASIVD